MKVQEDNLSFALRHRDQTVIQRADPKLSLFPCWEHDAHIRMMESTQELKKSLQSVVSFVTQWPRYQTSFSTRCLGREKLTEIS